MQGIIASCGYLRDPREPHISLRVPIDPSIPLLKQQFRLFCMLIGLNPRFSENQYEFIFEGELLERLVRYHKMGNSAQELALTRAIGTYDFPRTPWFTRVEHIENLDEPLEKAFHLRFKNSQINWMANGYVVKSAPLRSA